MSMFTSRPQSAASASGTDSSYELTNLGLAASVGSNLLTVSLKQKDGSSDPASGSSTVYIAFRDSTLANGKYLQRSVTGSLSVNTVATGASFGTVSAQNEYIYVYAIDNAGTVELALAGSRCFDENTRYSTTAIGAGSTDRYTLYSTSSRSNVAIRLIGRLLVNESTAGTYASAPTEISLTPFREYALNSEIHMTGANGHGATNTKIRIFVTAEKNVGTKITYATSSTNGDSFTINETGIYSVIYSDSNGAASSDLGISVNSAQLTTSITSITNANRLAIAQSAGGNFQANCVFIGQLKSGDVVRAHTGGACNQTTDQAVWFRITHLGRL